MMPGLFEYELFASTENEASWQGLINSSTDLLQANYQGRMSTSKQSLQAPPRCPECFALRILQFRALRFTFLSEFFSRPRPDAVCFCRLLASQSELAIKLWIVNVTMYKDMTFKTPYLRKGTDGRDRIRARMTVCARAPKHQTVGQ